jgi:hypothetical protein
VEHVHGTTNTDIRKAKYALERKSQDSRLQDCRSKHPPPQRSISKPENSRAGSSHRHTLQPMSGRKRYAENHLAGRCTLGDKCLRSHKVTKGKGSSSAPPGTRTPYPKSDKFKKIDERHPRAKMTFAITISREHPAAVGPPRGRQTTDKAQMNAL